jgi:hypothetical protein
MSEYKFENTVGGKLVASLREALADCIVVPNSMLPLDFHDNVRGGRTLKRLEEMCDKRNGLTDHVKIKAIKERNIARLAAQVAEGETDISEPIDYSQNECDEIAQHRAECALVNGMVNGGFLDADDLLED